MKLCWYLGHFIYFKYPLITLCIWRYIVEPRHDISNQFIICKVYNYNSWLQKKSSTHIPLCIEVKRVHSVLGSLKLMIYILMILMLFVNMVCTVYTSKLHESVQEGIYNTVKDWCQGFRISRFSLQASKDRREPRLMDLGILLGWLHDVPVSNLQRGYGGSFHQLVSAYESAQQNNYI